MTYDYFISSRYRNKDAVLELAQKLRAKGKSVYCFIESEASLRSAGSLEENAEVVMNRLERIENWRENEKVRDIFESDIQALRDSETIVVLLPGGKSTHMEAGVAYGLGKKLILVGEIEQVETLYLMFDQIFPEPDEFIMTL